MLVILALGLSGGALPTLVSLFNALLWRELPVSHPEELVGISRTDRRAPGRVSLPVSLFAALDSAQHVFQGLAGFHTFESIAVIDDTSQRLAIQGVSGRYFDTLRVRPALGRVVDARDVDSASPVATISFRSWHTRFGSDPDVIGQTFRVQGELVTVIGVAARAFTGLEVGAPADAWVPTSLAPVTAAAGLVAGVPCAFVAGRLVASSLTLVGAHDALAFGAAIALILVVTVLSVLMPLRRARHVTPIEALGQRV